MQVVVAKKGGKKKKRNKHGSQMMMQRQTEYTDTRPWYNMTSEPALRQNFAISNHINSLKTNLEYQAGRCFANQT